jgi:hypothetical protein
MPKLDSLSNVLLTMFDLSLDLGAENLFLRKRLALYLERKLKPRRARAANKLTLALLSRLLAWEIL